MKTKTYPKYKFSGVEWLGDVPEHWEVTSLKFICRFAYGDSLASEDREDGDYLVFGSNGPVGTHKLPNTTKPVIVVGRKGSYGKINYSDNQIFAIDTTYFIDSRYTTQSIQWLKLSLLTLCLDIGSKDSAVPGLAREDAYKKRLPLPPLPEQQAIAAFLDRETGRIDALIGKKKKLLSLLAEQRTALISRAVTNGLNPSVKLKPSGVEWLGDVPEHWEVKKLKWAYQSIRSGDGISPDDIEPIGSYPVYGGNGVMGYTEMYNSKHEDIIIGRVGAKCGNVYLIDGPKWISYNALKLNIHKVSRKYLALVLEERNLNQLANQNAQPLITGSMVGNQFITLPPLPEQQAIAAFLDRETAKIDTLSAKVQTAIERLKEYRTALISAAVTGKIDVREAV